MGGWLLHASTNGRILFTRSPDNSPAKSQIHHQVNENRSHSQQQQQQQVNEWTTGDPAFPRAKTCGAEESSKSSRKGEILTHKS